MYLGAALQRGQRLIQGFPVLLDEGVLLRAGDGPDPRHHGLDKLVPGAALQLGQRHNQVFLFLHDEGELDSYSPIQSNPIIYFKQLTL